MQNTTLYQFIANFFVISTADILSVPGYFVKIYVVSFTLRAHQIAIGYLLAAVPEE